MWLLTRNVRNVTWVRLGSTEGTAEFHLFLLFFKSTLSLSSQDCYQTTATFSFVLPFPHPQWITQTFSSKYPSLFSLLYPRPKFRRNSMESNQLFWPGLGGLDIEDIFPVSFPPGSFCSRPPTGVSSASLSPSPGQDISSKILPLLFSYFRSAPLQSPAEIPWEPTFQACQRSK